MLKERVRIEGKKFLVGQREIWFNGVNTPWQHWDDFGGKFDRTFWQEHYRMLHEKGINSSRVWVSCSGDVGIMIDEEGFVHGATKEYWEHVQGLLEAAEQNGVYIMATFMSFDHFKEENKNYLRWRSMVQKEETMDSYVQNFVIPFCEKFGHFKSLWSIDLCNEPDWIYENPECGRLSWENLGRCFAKAAAAIHECCDVLVTIGYAIVKYNSELYYGDLGSDAFLQSCFPHKQAYLDFYSTHYYEWMARDYGVPFDKTPDDFGIVTQKPVLMGEVPAKGLCGEQEGARPMNTTECYLGCLKNQWQGIMAWTSNGIDSCGDMKDIEPAAKAVLENAGKEKVITGSLV